MCHLHGNQKENNIRIFSKGNKKASKQDTAKNQLNTMEGSNEANVRYRNI